jgi:hypothetical protein
MNTRKPRNKKHLGGGLEGLAPPYTLQITPIMRDTEKIKKSAGQLTPTQNIESIVPIADFNVG